MMGELVAVGVGGFLGAIARYGVSQSFLAWNAGTQTRFPWATLLVNVIGSLALGYLMRRMDHWSLSPEWRAFLSVGFLGALTTFSTFSLEALQLFRNESPFQALIYVVSSLVLAFGAVALGWKLAAAA